MALLRNEKDNFEVVVSYVFNKDGDICVLDDLDHKTLSLTKEEKEKIAEEDRRSAASNIPFNRTLDLLEFSEKDVRKATFSFRKPVLDDMPVLLSSFIKINSSGDMAPGDVFEFSNRKVKLLFVKGKAQEQDGSEIKITKENIGNIPPVLGSAMSMKLASVLNI